MKPKNSCEADSDRQHPCWPGRDAGVPGSPASLLAQHGVYFIIGKQNERAEYWLQAFERGMQQLKASGRCQLDVAFPQAQLYEYRFTCDRWETEEVKADGTLAAVYQGNRSAVSHANLHGYRR